MQKRSANGSLLKQAGSRIENRSKARQQSILCFQLQGRLLYNLVLLLEGGIHESVPRPPGWLFKVVHQEC
jgi:hypothetical protein